MNELKAAGIGRYLPPEESVANLASDLAAIVKQVDAQLWITATRAGCDPMWSLAKTNQLPKDITRQILLERISGFATPQYFPEHSWLIVWDLSEARELIDFSHDISNFRNRVSRHPLSPPLTPAILGGLSHDWPGIQVADLYSNFALHSLGRAKGIPDANPEKADAFENILKPTLKRDNSGKEVGWRVWGQRREA